MSSIQARGLRLVWLLSAALALGCGSPSDSGVLRVDAEFNPAMAATVFGPVHEANPAVAQTFTIENPTGKFEEFWIVVTDGESSDDGVIRVTVRPTNGVGEPNASEASSIIDPIDVDTSTLPSFGTDAFTEFFVGDDPGREVLAGEEYAIVVEFVSRSGSETSPIARVAGISGNPYPDGTGSDGESGVGFTNNTDDYFFRTFVLE